MITKGIDRRGMFYWQVDRPFTENEVKEIFLDRGVSFDTKQAIAAVEYGLSKKVAKLHERFVRGSVNLVYRATLIDGSDVVIRIHPPGVKNGYFWNESVVSKLAKEHGVPSFDTLFIDDTMTKFSFDYMIIEALPGENMKEIGPLDSELDTSLIEDTGRLLALIHKVTTKGFGFFDNGIAKQKGILVGIHDRWQDHVFAALEENLKYLQDTQTITAESIKKIQKILQRRFKCRQPKLIQNDLADWNQLTDRKRITGILDWDECFSGDPVCDFSAWSVFYPFERMEHLKRGYKQVSPLPDGFEEKLHYYRVRYIVSKMVGRKKKLMKAKSSFIQELLDYAQKILHDEFTWYGMKSL